MNQTHFVQYMPPGRAPTLQHYPPPPQQHVAHHVPIHHHQQSQPQPQQHPQHHHRHTPSQPPTPQLQAQAPGATIAPTATYKQQPPATSPSSAPLVAQGDWTKNLVQLAKTAELKKHSLSLQLHTAHILSANAQLDSKNKELEDVKEEKTRLEAERTRLLSALREVNEQRDRADLKETKLHDECSEIRTKIKQLSEGEFAQVKKEVDALRTELGQSPTPTLEEVIRDKNLSFTSDKRSSGTYIAKAFATPPVSTGAKRSTSESAPSDVVKRPRGRPKGSKNKSKTTTTT